MNSTIYITEKGAPLIINRWLINALEGYLKILG